MADKIIEYKSAKKFVNTNNNILETIDRDGIVCTWNGKIVCKSHAVDWRRSTTNSFGGDNNPGFGEQKIDIDLKETSKTVTKEIHCNSSASYVTFNYHLTPHYAQKIEKVSCDEKFAASEMNDTVLVIEGKKLHVNKAFLSYHSDYFRALFSSNFKEGQMTEIPIKDVTYEDFALFLSTINPKQEFPTDKTVEKLLELADRFLMPSVTHIVEYHLLNNSNMGNEKLMWMADKYGMPKLLEKTIRLMDSKQKAKKLKASSEYQKLSLETIEKLFCRILQIC